MQRKQLCLLMLATCVLHLASEALGREPPRWYGQDESCSGCVFVYGISLPLDSEQEAIRNAVLNAYHTLAVQTFGIGFQGILRQNSNNRAVRFEEETTGLVRIQAIPSSVVLKTTIRGTDNTVIGYVKLRFQSSDIDTERLNQKKYAAGVFEQKLASLTSTQRIGYPTPLTGSFLLRGLPTKSQVYLNSEMIGSGEAYYPAVGIGEYRLTIVHRDFHTAETKFTIEPGKKVILDVELARKEGEIAVVTAPNRALLTLNGIALGLSPLKRRLPVGEYRLMVEKEGYPTKDLVVAVKVDTLINYELDLSKGRYPVQVNAVKPVTVTFSTYSSATGAWRTYGTYSIPKHRAQLRLPAGRFAYRVFSHACQPRSGEIVVDGKEPVIIDGSVECLTH